MNPTSTETRWVNWFGVLGLALALVVVYAPLVWWLGRASIQLEQLTTGAMLVLCAVVFSMRDLWRNERPALRLTSEGVLLVAAGFITMGTAGLWPRGALPLALLSFGLSVAGVVSFVFGPAGVRRFMPALSAVWVLGMLAGLFPRLDWPLRMAAGRYAAGLLVPWGVPVKLALWTGKPPELLIETGGRLFVVATECNGFGLLTSSLLLATILVFLYRLPWWSKAVVVGLAVPLAIVSNFLRIVAICLVAPRVDLPYQWIHEVIGTLFYLVGLWLVYRVACYAADTTQLSATS